MTTGQSNNKASRDQSLFPLTAPLFIAQETYTSFWTRVTPTGCMEGCITPCPQHMEAVQGVVKSYPACSEEGGVQASKSVDVAEPMQVRCGMPFGPGQLIRLQDRVRSRASSGVLFERVQIGWMHVQASLSIDAVAFRGPVDTTGYIRYQVSLIVLPYCGFGCLSREMCHFVAATIGLQGGRDCTCRIY
jgi:hypothetical protein